VRGMNLKNVAAQATAIPFRSSLHLCRLYRTFCLEETRQPLPSSSFPSLNNTFWEASYGAHGTEYCQLQVAEDGWTMTKLVGDVNVPSGQISWKTNQKFCESVQQDDISFTVDVQHAEENFVNSFWKSGTLTIVDDHQLEILMNKRSLMFHRVVYDPKVIRNVIQIVCI